MGVKGEPSPRGDCPIDEVIASIKAGEWQAPIEAIRAQVQARLADGQPLETIKKVIAGDKGKLPAMLVSGTFARRGDNNVIAYSGLLCADVDGLLTATEWARP